MSVTNARNDIKCIIGGFAYASNNIDDKYYYR